MTNEEKKIAYGMLLDGYSYQKVADRIGISRQAVHQHFGKLFDKKAAATSRIKYKNILNFMSENNITRREFAEKANLEYATLGSVLNGKVSPSKKTIDAILKFTGMTYEEAFAENEE